MTSQELYDAIRTHFTTRGALLSKDDNGDCYYRHPEDGRGCAVGCVIPDELYDPKMDDRGSAFYVEEGLGIIAVMRAFEGLGEYLVGNDENDIVQEQHAESFLTEAQTAHDNANSVEGFVIELDLTAKSYGLKVPNAQ